MIDALCIFAVGFSVAWMWQTWKREDKEQRDLFARWDRAIAQAAHKHRQELASANKGIRRLRRKLDRKQRGSEGDL